MKTIKQIHKAEAAHMGDLLTYRALPTRNVKMDDLEPFIFLNHHGYQVYKPNNQGLPFGPHPHKGFETVTFILKGDIMHKDTKGHKSVISAGGIQWMTAGKGIIHSEVSSEEFKKNGGELEILQLWVNLPAKHKTADPKYIGLQKSAIPAISQDGGKVTINLISGSWGSKKAPIQSLTDITMTTLYFKKGGKLQTEVDTAKRVFLYVVSGNVKINDKAASTHSLIEFNQEGKDISMEADTEAVLLFGHALPNNEPIVAKGPFVMNTMQEINEAHQEYYDGKYGEITD